MYYDNHFDRVNSEKGLGQLILIELEFSKRNDRKVCLFNYAQAFPAHLPQDLSYMPTTHSSNIMQDYDI